MEYWYAFTGPKHWQDLHIAHMQSQDVVIPGVAPNGQTFQQGMKMIYEPIQLVRVVLPEQALPILVNTLGTTADKGIVMNTASTVLRKILGLEEIPKDLLPVGAIPKLPVSTDYLNIIPLGIKRDEHGLMASTLVNQEKI